MSKGNGKGEEERAKWCPIMQEWCTKEVLARCALQAGISRNVGGLQQRTTLCVFQALLVMLSEINQKTQGVPQKKIVLPGQ